MNRLNLDYTIKTAADRSNFINDYVAQIKFVPNETELNKIANYILYGLDENGKNSVQNKEVEISTRYGTWDKHQDQSLEELFESPNFQGEASLYPINYAAPTKITKETFSREEAARIPELVAMLEPIWARIDELDLLLNYYDLKTGKRKKPPRQQLLDLFTPSQQQAIKAQADSLTPYEYLKRRHLLVEYRREQYSMRDQFQTSMIVPHSINLIEPRDIDYPYLPLGLKTEQSLIFQPFAQLTPTSFTEPQLRDISKHYWLAKSTAKAPLHFDFTNLDHIYNLYLSLEDASPEVRDTLQYYQDNTDLEPHQLDILNLKIAHYHNEYIANYINQKYNRTYTVNYISTIFRQKTLAKIAETASLHEQIISNIFFKENFKKCNTCGRYYLITADFFVRKSRATDGFSNRCKSCDKLERRNKK